MIKFNYMHKLSQSGAVSFLTVIFLAIVLTIMTLSFVRISVNEHRQAIDDDLTIRAFYAAESGIEDGKRALADWLKDPAGFTLNGDVCTPAENVTPDVNGHVVLSIDNSAAYTCQFIEMAPGEFQTTLDPWESVTIPLNAGTASFDRIKISWHEPANDASGSWNRHAGTTLPPVSQWINYPAMLRTTVIGANAPAGTSFDSTQVSSYTGFINPNQNGSPSVTAPNLETQQIVNGHCNTTVTGSTPACEITITSLPGTQKFLHIESIYRGTHLTVQLFNNATKVNIVDTQAIIDVTGRAGDVYRRIQARVSLIPNNTLLPDVSIWSNEEICKDFKITNQPTGFVAPSCKWFN